MTIVIRATGVAAAAAHARGQPAGEDGGDGGDAGDRWLDAVGKLIPGEVIIAFTTARQLPGLDDDRSTHLVILIACAALCPLVLWAAARAAGLSAHWLQYLVRSGVFALYALADDTVLLTRMNEIAWLPALGAPLLVVLSALVLAPPGVQGPPPTMRA